MAPRCASVCGLPTQICAFAWTCDVIYLFSAASCNNATHKCEALVNGEYCSDADQCASHMYVSPVIAHSLSPQLRTMIRPSTTSLAHGRSRALTDPLFHLCGGHSPPVLLLFCLCACSDVRARPAVAARKGCAEPAQEAIAHARMSAPQTGPRSCYCTMDCQFACKHARRARRASHASHAARMF